MSVPLTSGNGAPISDDNNSKTAGYVCMCMVARANVPDRRVDSRPYGPILLEDFHLVDKLAHFDRERIPERVVHAKGAGAFGYFEVTHDITKYSKAKLFNKVRDAQVPNVP